MTGEAAGGTEGGAGEGLPVGWGGISFCWALEGAAAFTIGPGPAEENLSLIKHSGKATAVFEQS